MRLLEQQVSSLYGIGKKKAEIFSRLHIETVGDLIQHYPRSYENRGEISLLCNSRSEGKTAVLLTVATEPRTVTLRRGLSFLKFRAYDDSGLCDITYFNQNYLKDTFPVGSVFRFWGRVERYGERYQMSAPVAEAWDEEESLPSLIPVYRVAEGLSQKQIRQNISDALRLVLAETEDHCPERIRTQFGLCTLAYALRNIHQPENYEALATAKRRLIFDELFDFSMNVVLSRSHMHLGTAPACSVTGEAELKAALPYRLTAAQERVTKEIYADMAKAVPMNRIIVGDVGCGKTVCAAAAVIAAVRSGHQAALMVPTEILARQHARDLSDLFDRLGIRTALLIGAMTQAQKQKVYKRLQSADPCERIDCVIGTQALLSEGVSFADPALVITDEQHRFGVRQRAVLSGKNQHAHMLVMSATPIPRTLGLVMYGDLSISRIDQMPPGRQRVDTYVVNESFRQRINAFIRKQVQAGGQVYVICPSVEEREVPEDEIALEAVGLAPVSDRTPPLKAAVSFTEELRKALPELDISFVHGQMKPSDKEKVMADFAEGKIQVLVSTTVIEVGVNVPNACLMIVENAERFGLSQLHQLRGRVGRGTRKSYCILVSETANTETNAGKRLETMRTTYDGYAIAEQDLAIRGPGDFLNVNEAEIRQSGGIDFRLADFCGDMELMNKAFESARRIVEEDGTLSAYPLLRRRLERSLGEIGGMMN